MDLTDRLARGAGIDPEVLAGLPRFRESRLFSDLEKLALEDAEAMTATPARVPEELFRALATQLSPGGMALR